MPNNLRDDQMICPECGRVATCESIDVGVPGHLYVDGRYVCACGWEYDADGKMNVEKPEDYYLWP